MNNKCNKCEVVFADGNMIKCFGGCEKAYHFGCSSLSITNAKLCANNVNIKFVCGECLSNQNNRQQTLQTLMVQLTEVSNLLTNLFNNFQSLSSNLVSEPQNTQNVVNTVTPNLNTINGNNYNNVQPVITGTDDTNCTLEIVKPKKYLHISNFKPTTTCEDIKNHLLNKIQMPVEDSECHELVSNRTGRSLLNFISFKVGLDPTVYDKAYDGNIWPVECAIKPFINFRRTRRVPATATLSV